MYPKVTLKENRHQSWLYGHPWIFSKAIKTSPNVDDGSLVEVYDYNDNFLGIGYLNTKQSIAIRMLTSKNVTIDTNWFKERFNKLKNFKNHFLNQTTAYRLCFGESDSLAGLVVDAYGENAFVQINTKGIENLITHIIEALTAIGFQYLHIDINSQSAKKEKVNPAILKNIDTRIKFFDAIENNIKIRIPLEKAQKTGWFCDQRDNRKLVRDLVEQFKIKKVLNLFSYTGGFSLYALYGGAEQVINVDQDQLALKLFEEMVAINHLSKNYVNIHTNIWDFFNQSNETYDLVIADPPAFVKDESKKAAGMKGYVDVFKNAALKVSPGGFMMVYSCSRYITENDFNWILRQVFEQSKRSFQCIKKLYQPFDHPSPPWFEESNYLKGYLLYDVL
jgi:23S rRNA (cytosine1962-C5)-methyltransferase